jgi:putative NIF3 family GTP cyclohydrolase 1 type 2
METNSNNQPAPGLFDRKTFISTTTKAIGSAVLLSSSLKTFAAFNRADGEMTVGQVMDLFISEVPGAPFEKTVDTLKAGNRDIKVTGIVTTMFATVKVIQQAISAGANFIIAHEPTFYNHLDETAWLENDDVYRYKASLLKKHNIAVWRNHDYIHQHVPDGVEIYVVGKLRWTKLYDPSTGIATLPATPLKTLISHAKQALGISMVRYNGDLNQPCKKILLMPGASGGKSQITAVGKHKPDVLLCGEIQEWETAEYVRDAQTKGDKLSLVVLGHIASEEPGSEYMANWLKQKLPAIKVTHIQPGNSLSFL